MDPLSHYFRSSLRGINIQAQWHTGSKLKTDLRYVFWQTKPMVVWETLAKWFLLVQLRVYHLISFSIFGFPKRLVFLLSSIWTPSEHFLEFQTLSEHSNLSTCRNLSKSEHWNLSTHKDLGRSEYLDLRTADFFYLSASSYDYVFLSRSLTIWAPRDERFSLLYTWAPWTEHFVDFPSIWALRSEHFSKLDFKSAHFFVPKIPDLSNKKNTAVWVGRAYVLSWHNWRIILRLKNYQHEGQITHLRTV